MIRKQNKTHKRMIIVLLTFSTLLLLIYSLISFSIWPKDYFWIERTEAEMPVWVKGNTESGVFVVFVHGGPGSSGTLESIIEVTPANGDLDHESPLKVLEKEYAVVYWDQRHAGMSKGKVDPNTSRVEDFARDLEMVINEVTSRYSVDSLFIMGQSFGHAVSINYLTDLDNWRDNQLKVSGYIDYKGNHEQNMPYQIAREKMLDLANENIDNEIDLDYWKEILDYYTTKTVMTELADMSYHSMYISEAMNVSISLMDRISSSVKASIWSPFNGLSYYPNNKNTNSAEVFMKQIMFDQSLSTSIEKLAIPTLLIYGKNDLIAPPEIGEFIIDIIQTDKADKKLLVLSHSRHGAEGEDIKIFQNEMVQFIERFK